MKLLINFTLILFSTTLSAQKLGDNFNEQLFKKQFDSLLKRSFKIGAQTSPGWHFLHQDHMPCFVPDTKGISKIRNLWDEPVLVFRDGNMPNLALPPDDKVKKEQ